MQHPCKALTVLSCLLLGLVTPAAAQVCPSGLLALVLSGGGAKGLAHIGVLRVLEREGIRPDLVVGTSMGAIIGAMYASGYDADQIEALASSLDLASIITGTKPRTSPNLGERRPLIVWEQGSSGFHTAEAGAREAAVSNALNRILLRGNLQARGNFDSLRIPYRAIATDLRTRAEVVLSGGDLARAVRASMSIPLVFAPERIDERDLIDGGLAANLPIAAARRAGARRLIVSDVGWRPQELVKATDPLAVADRLVSFLFVQPLDSLSPVDRLIRPAIDSFTALDFAPEKIQELIHRGETAARDALDVGNACTAPSPPAREVPTEFHLAGTSLTGGPPRYLVLLRRQLALEESAAIDVAGLADRLYAIGETDDYRELWLDPTGAPDSLVLNLQIRLAPPRVGFAGLAYDNDLGGQMWLGAVDRGATVHGVEASGTFILAELRQELSIGLRTSAFGRHPRRPLLSGTVARERVRQFSTRGDLTAPIRTSDARGFLGLERRLGTRWLVTAGGIAQAWDAPGSTRSSTLGGSLRISSGPSYLPSGLWMDGTLSTAYRRATIEVRQTVVALGLRMTPSVRYGWGRNLPLIYNFSLGGDDGFPGLNIDERRGDRELMGRLNIARRIFGPVDLLLEAATGQVADGGPTLPRGRYEIGGRIGLGANTPIGPIRFQYGHSRGERGGIVVRVGEWF